MQRLKLYLSRVYFGDSVPRYKLTKKGGYIASREVYAYVKKLLSELNIIESEKHTFEEIVLDAEDICTLLEDGVEVFIV